MLFTKKKGITNSIRTVKNDDKSKILGLVGTVEDFLQAGVMTKCSAPKTYWCFIPEADTLNAQFGTTREAACAGIE